ncbi:hypothetical protein G9C98_000945 [Cotesia typhae]|uniref:Uncharacterized protein n=1 Tax=Cotesia typhae TaxID=2053667 RepID=A0A8J5RHZ0_9HYME|nr:hypothetical protein G9C98_000945 [Cotesia typhae]
MGKQMGHVGGVLKHLNGFIPDIFHIFIAMFLWSYWKTVFTDLISVPEVFKVVLSEVEKLQQAQSEEAQCAILERLGQNLPVSNRTIRGEAFRPPMFRMGKDKDGFNIGKYNNFQEVFGENKNFGFFLFLQVLEMEWYIQYARNIKVRVHTTQWEIRKTG